MAPIDYCEWVVYYESDKTNTTYLWHHRLGHIGKKRMKKLHSDGLLESFDYESFDTYKSCVMGKND
jgi:hypothetical protein